MRRLQNRVLASTVGLAAALTTSAAAAAPGFAARCEHALRKPQIDDLVAHLRDVDGPCRVGRIDTDGYRTHIDWHQSDRTHTVLLGPRPCIVEPTLPGDDVAAISPPDFATACPAAHAALATFIATSHALAPIATADNLHNDEFTLVDPRILATCVAWLTLGLALALAVQRLRAPRAPDDRSWLTLALALFGLGLLARFLVAPAPANWYGAFLLPTGWGDLRFGPGAAIVQSAVRAALPWTVDVAFASFRVIGALAVPLTVVLVRRLGGTLAAAALAGLIVALAPIPVRLSSSSAEHILTATLALAAWATWLRTAADPSIAPRALAILLAWCAALTRVDSLPQLALIPLWTTLAAPLADRGWLPPRRRLLDATIFYSALAIIAAIAWLDIVVPSHHPGPELHGLLQTSKHLLWQFWTAAATPPHWIPLPLLLVTILGLLAATRHRRWLLAALASLALMFIPLGRNLAHDGLTGARYFVLLMPLLALIAIPAIARIPRRITPFALAAFVILLVWSGQSAYHHETTFQAEHRFLAHALDDPRLADCTVWFVRPRQLPGEPDLDCCLSPEQSPLTLRFPHLRFAAVSQNSDPDAAGCHLFYEGAVCSVDPSLAPAAPQTTAHILEQCNQLRRGRVLASETVTAETVTSRFTAPPTLTLRRRE